MLEHVLNMKQSSRSSSKPPRGLAQYSSGEDDSGTEEILIQNHDLNFTSFLPRALDLRVKKHLSQSVLRQNRYKRTGLSGEPPAAVNSHTFESSSSRKNAVRHSLASTQGAAGPSRSSVKPDMRQRSPQAKARLASELNSEAGLLDESKTGLDTDVPIRTHPLSDLGEQVKSDDGQNNDRIPIFPHLQDTLKKTDSSRKALTDITKETVAEFQYQVPSYFSRDVLPLDAENSTECDSSEFIRLKSIRSKNNYPDKEGSRYSEHASNGIPSRNRQIPVASPVDMSREFKTTEEKDWFSLHYQKVSMILVAVVLLFFIGLGLMYLNVCFKDSHRNFYEEHGNVYPICGSSENLVQCIPENQISTVLSMLQVLTPKLMSVAVDSYCNSSGDTAMTDSDVLQYMVQNMKMDSAKVKMNLPNLKLLILHNPLWGIKVIGEKDAEVSGINNLPQQGKFLFKNPLLPLSCQLKLFIGTLLCCASLSNSVLLAAVVGFFTLWHCKRRSEQHRQEVYMLVNKIILAVRNHYQHSQLSGINGVPYLPVEKCRSAIINSKQSKCWDEAVKIIETNESRIITDVQNVHGKPTKVWQWQSMAPPRPEVISGEGNSKSHNMTEEPARSQAVSSVSSSTDSLCSTAVSSSKCRRNKVWQGQAFDTIAGSPNSLQCSPTPCLKIRNMFDPDLEHGDDWPILIQDSILEKCEGVCVLHLHVESSSPEGCVFMKCSSPEEAGKAYRALHGWWFDAKLVTVKYLRTERYHERCPEAASASCPLRPSNNQRLSLQKLWHFPSEST